MKNILLLCGGGSQEHEVSLVSANFLQAQLELNPEFNVLRVEIDKQGAWVYQTNDAARRVELDVFHQSIKEESLGEIKIDYAIPCIHGFPGETGDIQSLFELAKIPYMGCSPQASVLSFNKISSKLWYDALNIPNTPYLFLSDQSDSAFQAAQQAFATWGKVFVKAASQGSSVGCYCVEKEEDLTTSIKQAFEFSDQVLIEKALKPRELELAAFEYQGKLYITPPGEVRAPEGAFYSYEEKYSADSHSTTFLDVLDISDAQKQQLMDYAALAFKQMKLKDLSRIDFFMTPDGEIYLNEINTFPGMTPISMFPKLMENHGVKFADYLADRVNTSL